MNAIETLGAYCESKGWSPIGPRLFLNVLNRAKCLEEQSSSRRWWTDVTRVVEVNGVLYQYDGAETTGDETPSEKGWEFDPSSICFVKATKKMMPVLLFETSESPCSIGDAESVPEDSEEMIANVCHEVNRAYCQAMGDDSQPKWEDAPQWQKDSAMLGVKLHMSGDHGPEASHESWRTQKFNDGWRWGPVKDPAKKEHPCMVDFADLPKEQQAKDFLFRGVVHALCK